MVVIYTLALKKINKKYSRCSICDAYNNCIALFTRISKYMNNLPYVEWFIGECCYSKIKDEPCEMIYNFLMKKETCLINEQKCEICDSEQHNTEYHIKQLDNIEKNVNIRGINYEKWNNTSDKK